MTNTSKCIDREIGNLLHLYEMSALSEADVERFEAHLMKCQHCFREISSFEQYAKALRYGTKARDIISEWSKGNRGESPPPPKIWQRLWPSVPFLFRPAVIYTALILVLISALVGIQYLAHRNGKVRPIQTILLSPVRTTPNNIFRKELGNDGVLRFVVPQAIPGSMYDILITDQANDTVARIVQFSDFDEYRQGFLILPLARMEPGIYRFIISESVGDSLSATTEYRFKIEP